MLLATILPNNPKMRMRIEKNLSMREISKQIDADTFDFRVCNFFNQKNLIGNLKAYFE